VPITYAISPPSVGFSSPASGVTLQDQVAIEANVSDSVGVSNVQMFIDGTQVASFSSPPYRYLWDAPNAIPGPHILRIVATNSAGKSAASTRSVSSRPTPPPPPPPPYLGEIASISPALSFGDQTVTLTGRAKNRSTGALVPGVQLQLLFIVDGFRRQIGVTTDSSGNFTSVFAPQSADSGNYSAAVIHPDDTSPPQSQGTFSIGRLTASPTRVSLTAARGIEHTFVVNVTAGKGVGSSGVRVQALASDQPSGSLPTGLTVRQVSGAASLAGGQSTAITIGVSGSAAAAETGTVVLTLYANESGSTSRSRILLDYRLVSATPNLTASRTIIETGAAQGTQVTEAVTLENRGVVAASNVSLQLLDTANQPAPAWAFLSTAPQLGSIAVGEKLPIQLTAAPPSNLPEGIYQFKLRVSSANAVGGEIPFVVRVASAGLGGAQFKVANIYTNTLDANSNRILGLAGARVRLQSETNAAVVQEGVTNASGEITLTNLPTGRYTYRVSAKDHADTSGRFVVRSGTVGFENVFLDISLVTVEFSVTETTVQDRYDVRLVATFMTEVPAPVVVIEPGAINIPAMQVGEVFTGELSIANYGLVRADNFRFTPPKSDQYYRFEFLGQIPTELAAKERITIPYRITALQLVSAASAPAIPKRSLFDPEIQTSTVLASAKAGVQPKSGSCSSYSAPAAASFDYTCANGDSRGGGATAVFAQALGSACGSTAAATISASWAASGIGIPGGVAGNISQGNTEPLGPGCAPECNQPNCKPKRKCSIF
jgi:hypothetical protein